MVKIIFFTLFMSLTLGAHSETLVDPTAPLNYQVKSKRTAKVTRSALPNLQSIVIKSGQPQAIMNNKIYKQGQRIGSYKILAIDAKKVLLGYQNKTYKLTLYSASERFSQ